MITTLEMEYSINNYFVNIQNFLACVPRVSKGFKIHECDILAISKKYSLIEIEIKRSVADCKADKKKEHKHKDKHHRLQYQYFAVPKSILVECVPYIPEHFGILTVDDTSNDNLCFYVEEVRKPKLNPYYRIVTQGEVYNLLSTGSKRYWSLIKTCYEKGFDFGEENEEEDEGEL